MAFNIPTLAEANAVRRAVPKAEMRLKVVDRVANRRDRDNRASTFRAAVWSRDKSMCRLCGRRVSRSPESTVRGHVHHLRGRNVAPEDKFNPKAALLVCAICHAKIHAGQVPKP